MALPASPASSSSASTALYRSLEGLLRERKLDRTLTSAFPDSLTPEGVAPFGLSTLDTRLLGGLPRGHVSELIGPTSSGRTSLAWTWLGTATARGEAVALVDSFDRFDPASGAACGIDLQRLLWVRGQAITKTAGAVDPAWLPGARAVEGPGTLLERTIDRSLKSLNLVLQSRVCTAVVLDFADVPLAGLRRVPLTTWMRLQRIVEGTDIACLLMGPVPLTRSAGGITVAMSASSAAVTRGGVSGRAERTIERSERPRDERAAVSDPAMYRRVDRWSGDHDRARRLAGLSTAVRVSSSRQTVQGSVTIDTTTRLDAWAVD
jgi:hypothetical protein